MIKHIVKQIWNQRRSNGWIWLELILVSVFLWYVVDFLYMSAVTYTAPTGYDIEHVYNIQLGESTSKSIRYVSPEQNTTTAGEDYLTIIDRIRNYPGVEAVSVSNFGAPYAQGSRGWYFRIDTINVGMYYARVTADFFRVFRIKDVNGDYETLARTMEEPNKTVITAEAVKKINSTTSVIQKGIYMPDIPDSVMMTIAGVSTSLRKYEYVKPDAFCYISQTDDRIAKVKNPDDLLYWELAVRVDPAMEQDFPDRFMKDMFTRLAVGNMYLQEVQPYSYLREAFIRESGERNEVKTQVSITFFLLANIFLGIIGTFWFRTEYRKGEMGLRMAIGSTRRELRRIMIQEGLLLLAIAFIPALIINANLASLEVIHVEQMPSTFLRFLITTCITYLLMVGMIIAGIWYPASQTVKLEPAEALHYE